MKKSLQKKITRYFKSDTDKFMEELNDYRKLLDNANKKVEQNLRILESALAKHIALKYYLDEKRSSKQKRIKSIDKVVSDFVKTGKDKAARELLREKVKEQQKLLSLCEIIDLHNLRIQEYQVRVKKANDALDYQKSNREAFLIKQQIAIEELLISEKLDKKNCKEHIKRVQRDILNKDSYKLLDLNEGALNDVQIDGEVEKELSVLKRNSTSNNL